MMSNRRSADRTHAPGTHAPGSSRAERAALLALAVAVLAGIVLMRSGALAAAAGGAPAGGCPAPNGDAYSTAVLADHPIAYYRLDEAEGPTLCDSSASANDGTYNATGITYGLPGPLISGDTAIEANGETGVVGQSKLDSGIEGNHSFTLEAWFKNTEYDPTNGFNNPYNNHVLVDIGQPCSDMVAAGSCNNVSIPDGSIAGLALYPNYNQQLGFGPSSGFGIDAQGSSVVWDPTTVGINLWDGKWHYLAVTVSYDESGNTEDITGYVDGHDLGSPTRDIYDSNQLYNIAAAPIALGQWATTGYFYPLVGGLDEVAVYPTALSPERIEAHYAAASQQELTVSTVGQGTITSEPSGIDCGAQAIQCSEAFENGSKVTLTAEPVSGYTFTGWSGGGCSGTGTCTVTMNSNEAVTAIFNTTTTNNNTTTNNTSTSTSTTTSTSATNASPPTPTVSPPSSAFTVASHPSGGVTLPSGYTGVPVQTSGACDLSLTEASAAHTASVAGAHHKHRLKTEGLIEPFRVSVASAGLHVLPLIPTKKELRLWRRQHHKRGRKASAAAAIAAPDPISITCQPVSYTIPTTPTPGPIALNSFSLTPAPSNTVTAGSTQLGGLDLDGYCRSIGYVKSQVDGPIEGPDAATKWVCVSSSGGQAPIDLEAACKYQYPGFDTYLVENINNAYSGQCWAKGTPTGAGTTTTVNVTPPPPPAPALSGCWSRSSNVASVSICVSDNQVTSITAAVHAPEPNGITCIANASLPHSIPLNPGGYFSFDINPPQTDIQGGFSFGGQLIASGGVASVRIGTCDGIEFNSLTPP